MEARALLEGETAEWSARDAEHWTGVYAELISFCRQALEGSLDGDSERIRRRLRDMEQRLAFWSRRDLTKP